ncbi:MAG TPA: iron donor protein CyaY [Noviherbaspirillum sp.]|jgi:CyaY protein|uniref:iron donor protein CyaY n=1 Tax=Noviherbaspirillum sp. TaxID=1926288 RepID=UPI002DDD610C|nr:iron donor protein CyaY [Noviherbaspirillum sp.]HEV2609688.1 iron donor protein CyaY [Noviherbaspirillum sp.]
MTESEFLALAEAALARIETILEAASDNGELDVECSRSGNVLEIEFIDNGSKIIVNSQTPMQELWIAARSGGFHYRHENGRWLNTRDRSELFASLATMVNEQGNANIVMGERA